MHRALGCVTWLVPALVRADPVDPYAGPSAPAWPSAIIDRPLTLPSGKLGVYGDLELDKPQGGGTSEGAGVGFGIGVTDEVTLGAEYTFALHDFEIRGPLTLYGSYAMYRDHRLTIAASAGVVINFDGEDQDTGTPEVDVGLDVGFGVRYAITPTVALFTGTPIAPGPVGRQVTIGLNNGGGVGFDLPIGIAVQATPQLYAWLSTELLDINVVHAQGVSDSYTDVLIRDFIPLTVGAYYAADPHLDIGAFVTLPDLKHDELDELEVGIAARFFD